MKALLPLALLSCLASAAFAQILATDYTRTIFADDFSHDGFGKRWGHYKSSSVVKDGMLIGITDEKSDHSAVDSITFPGEKDLEVSVKFRYTSEKAQSFGVWFDDKNYKDSHAGHICNIRVSPTIVSISDGKTGTFSNAIHEKQTNDKNKAPGGLTAEDKEFLKKMVKNIPVKLALQDWHTLIIRTKGDVCDVIIDGNDVGSFQSPGIAHETKTLVSLTTNRVDVNYKDFSIKAAAKG
jgi:hypothetical protein